jgi:tetratricopeptide (TPR) repeat protein
LWYRSSVCWWQNHEPEVNIAHPSRETLALSFQLICLAFLPAVYAQETPSLPKPPPNPYLHEVAPGEPDRENLIDRGESFYVQGRVLEAQDAFTEYARRHPSDPYGFYWLGKLSAEAGQTDRAANLYVKSEDLAKRAGMDASELRTNLGNALVKLGFLDEALYDYKRAIQMNPKDALARLNYAKLLLLKENFGPALQELNKANELGLDDQTIVLFRAMALRKMGKVDESKREAAQFLDTAPNSELRGIAQSLIQQ